MQAQKHLQTPPKTFVFISITPWDFKYGNNSKDMAIELAKNHRVVYINPPIRRKEALKGQKKPYQVVAINEHLKVVDLGVVLESLNFIKISLLFDRVNWWNAKRFSAAINQFFISEDLQDIVFINDNDVYNGVYLSQLLQPKPYMVYYMRDNLSALDFWKRNVARLEPILRKSYDLVVTNSVYYKDISAVDNLNAHYIGQGCDFSHFTNFDLDTKLIGKKNKIRIGYTGALVSSRLDISLIKYLAKTNPDFEFVLAGPMDKAFEDAQLELITNITVTGPIPYDQVAALNNTFDVCINPQLVNEMTKGNYPRKIDEFLALGKPVVATRTLAMEEFEPVCYLATDFKEFNGQISTALSEQSPELSHRRKEFAAKHSWEASIQKLLSALPSR